MRALYSLALFLCGFLLALALVMPGGEGVDTHWPDFWTVECK